MMNVKELEDAIKEEKKALVKLEDLYEREEDEKKCVKFEYRISRKEEQIDKLVDRQIALLDKEAETGAEGKDENAEEEDKDVCESCGGDLVYVETSDEGAVYECEKCKELYLDN